MSLLTTVEADIFFEAGIFFEALGAVAKSCTNLVLTNFKSDLNKLELRKRNYK